MPVTGVSHIPIGVRDMDRSLRFWRDFMGFEVTGDTGTEFAGRRSVFLRWNADKTSVFMSLSATERHEPLGSAVAMGDLGINHIAFWVDDLDDCVERAKEMSIELQSGPMRYDRPYADHEHGESFRTAIFLDPDGVAVQLDEWR